MRAIVCVALSCFSAFGFSRAVIQTPSEAIEQAKPAADSWLKLLDEGRYGESWEQAAAYFKERVPREKWESMVRSVREPLGKLLSRTVKSTQFTKELPGAPDGQYVIIQYDTSYENKKSAIETVTVMREKNGDWRVSGYFIR